MAAGLYRTEQPDPVAVSRISSLPSDELLEFHIRETLIPESQAESLREISEQVRASGVELLYRPSEGVGYVTIRNLQIAGKAWTVLWYLNQLIELEKELG